MLVVLWPLALSCRRLGWLCSLLRALRLTQRDSVMSDACILLVRESRVKRRDGVNATHGLCAVEDACMHFR